MKALFIAINLTLFAISNSFCQVSAGKPKSLKLFGSMHYSGNGSPDPERINSLNFSPAAALAIQTRANRFLEIGVGDLRISSETTNGVAPSDVNSFNLALRGSYNIGFGANEDAKVRPYLGLAIAPQMSRWRVEPMVSNIFLRWNNTYTISAQILPRAIMDLNSRFFLEINAPIRIYDLAIVYSRINNPSLPIEQQRSNHADGSFFPELFELNIGLGMWL